jgi:hypothetical protein
MPAIVLQQLFTTASDLIPLLEAHPTGGLCFVALVICATAWHLKR